MSRLVVLLLVILLVGGGTYFLSTLPKQQPARTIESDVAPTNAQ